jgi:tetratricopeptide (TPR) repeat protein
MYGCLGSLSPSVLNLLKEKREIADKIVASSGQYTSSPKHPPLVLGEEVDVHQRMAISEIGRYRSLLAESPGRPFCWSELSRNFLIVGEKEKAKRAMNAALQLAKHNRYLCRVATRLFVHIEEEDQALHLLRREPAIKNDPWLLAAEIAVSSISQKQSKFIDTARRVIASRQFNDNQLSELAAAVGTVELMHGTVKRAKSMFQMSLIAPTDNSLAQAQWAVSKDAKIVIPDSVWMTTDSYEAKTLASRINHDWGNALRTCSAWLADEPFSVRPAMLGSYLGFRPEHAEIAEQFATAGLRCDSTNTMLLNNRAVARVYQGKIKEAYEDINAALQDGHARHDAHLLATLGLIAFRSGDIDFGRDCYKQSIGWFSNAKESASVASAMLYLLREEIRIDKSGIPESIDLVERISKMPIAVKHPELFGMTQLFLEEARADAGSGSIFNECAQSQQPSQEELFRCASLFHVPDKAKQIAPQLWVNSDLI